MSAASSRNAAEWRVDGTLRLPTLSRLWREWRCSRKHEHGPEGFYPPHRIIDHDSPCVSVWMQECQSCGRFTVWSERRDPRRSTETPCTCPDVPGSDGYCPEHARRPTEMQGGES